MAQTIGTNNCTSECHKRTVRKNLLHGPTATDCLSCHIPNGKVHPLEDVAGFTYFAEGADLCYSCHEASKEEHDLKYKHKPAKIGQCSECHEVHSSNDPRLVFATAPDLCFFCHGDYEDNKESSKSVHAPSFEGDSCLMCHTPHASSEKKLLRDSSKQLCLNCHNKIIKIYLDEE